MHILILNWRDITHPLSGGAEIVTHEHAKAWVKAGHMVTWMTASYPHAKKEEVIDGIWLKRLGNKYSVFFKVFFAYLLSRKDYSIVVDEIHGIPFFTPLYVRKPIIAFIHEVAGDIWDKMFPFPVNIVGRLAERISFLFYKHIPFWTDSSVTIEDLVRYGIPKKNCLAIPCPITNKVRNTVPLKEKNLTFLFVGRLVKMKGIEDILEAFSFIYQKDKKAHLWIVGSGEKRYVLSLKKLAKSLRVAEAVTFYGYVDSATKLSLMSRSHLLLHASTKEGWGLVVLEAASQATPAVVYNSPGLRDIVISGKTGIVVDANTPQQLAKAALTLVENKELYFSMQKKGILWVKTFTWERVTEQSLALIQKYAVHNSGKL